MNIQTTQSPQKLQHLDEDILVVKTSTLFLKGSWQGLKTDHVSDFFSLIQHEKEFHPRSVMETDTRYKQIIPYLIFNYEDRYFLMQRDGNSSEQRLKNNYTLGIGGHVRKEDLFQTTLLGWAEREFHEEVSYAGSFEVTPLGILNDDSNPVGEVHIGYVLLIKGDSPDISVKSELKSGKLATLNECATHYPQMEQWSKIVFEALKRAG